MGCHAPGGDDRAGRCLAQGGHPRRALVCVPPLWHQGRQRAVSLWPRPPRQEGPLADAAAGVRNRPPGRRFLHPHRPPRADLFTDRRSFAANHAQDHVRGHAAHALRDAGILSRAARPDAAAGSLSRHPFSRDTGARGAGAAAVGLRRILRAAMRRGAAAAEPGDRLSAADQGGGVARPDRAVAQVAAVSAHRRAKAGDGGDRRRPGAGPRP